jgi:2'-5' RNA ligase
LRREAEACRFVQHEDVSADPSAVVVPVPDVEPVVCGWRERFDRSAAQGMPAHITALYPFLPRARLTDGILARLGELCAVVSVLEVEFRRTSRFGDVLYLDPEPAGELAALTASIATAWPETPPYGGAFAEVIPHLTVAQGASEQELRDVEANVLSKLPIRTELTHASLYVIEAKRWRAQTSLPFTARS